MSESMGSIYDHLVALIQRAFGILAYNHCGKSFTLTMNLNMELHLDAPPPGATALTPFLRQLEKTPTMKKAAQHHLANISGTLKLFLELLDAIHALRERSGNQRMFFEDLASLIGGSAVQSSAVGRLDEIERRPFLISIIPTAAIIGILQSYVPDEPVRARVSRWLQHECPAGLRSYCEAEIGIFLREGDTPLQEHAERPTEIIQSLPPRGREEDTALREHAERLKEIIQSLPPRGLKQ